MNSPFLPLFQILALGFTFGESLHRRSERSGRIYYLSMGTLLLLLILSIAVLSTFGKAGLVFTVPISGLFRFLSPSMPHDSIGHFFASVTTFGLLGLLYLVMLSFPLSVCFLPLRRRVVDSKPALRVFSEKRFSKGRRKGQADRYFAGINAVTGEMILISDESRLMHQHIIGVTGAAKTEGGILPALMHDIFWGRGSVIIDMKGDRGLLERIEWACEKAGRIEDLRYISLGDPDLSHTINPFRRGNPSEQKDKLISALNWTEEFYKKVPEIAVLKLCKALQALKRPVTFRALLDCLKSLETIKALGEELKRAGHPDDLSSLLTILNKSIQPLAGLLADLTAVVDSSFGHLFEDPLGEVDFLDAYLERKIVFLQFNTGLYQETAVRLARLFLQDIKSMSNHVQTYIPPEERRFFSIFVDEFAMVAFPAFIDLLNKARSAKIAITIAHQSLGDLEQFGPFIASQIQDNTNIKMIFRQSDPDSVNKLSQLGGTYETERFSYQTTEDVGGTMNTGQGNSRIVEKFRVDPNLIKELPRGYCAFIEKDTNRTCFLQTDYLPVKGSGAFLKGRAKDIPQTSQLVQKVEGTKVHRPYDLTGGGFDAML